MIKVCIVCKNRFSLNAGIKYCPLCGGELEKPDNIEDLEIPKDKPSKKGNKIPKQSNLAYR